MHQHRSLLPALALSTATLAATLAATWAGCSPPATDVKPVAPAAPAGPVGAAGTGQAAGQGGQAEAVQPDPEAQARARRIASNQTLIATDGSRPPPVLMVRVEERLTPLSLQKVHVDATVVGHLAETSMTMTFYNPNPRAMEGDLYVPLPEGATISRYALDVNGTLVDGVVVSKDKGRQVFETEVRKGIDPGLIEWTKGNNFKTRIFPIPARGTRTIRVGYVSEVASTKEGALYHLPLDYRDPVDAFSLNLEVVKSGAPPIVAKGGPAGLAFQQQRHSYVARSSVQNVRLTDDLVVTLPDLAKQPVHVETGADGTAYFAIRHALQNRPQSTALSAPKRIAIYWDASSSRAKGDHKKELAVLETYLGSLTQAATAELVLIRNAAEHPRRFALPGQRAQLLKAMGDAVYDGATQLGQLGSVGNADINLVFSDGLSTFGDEKPTGLKAPTYVLNQSSKANHALLRYLAMTTGGAYFNLQRVAEKDAASAIGKQVFSFIRAEAKGADLADLYPHLRTPVTDVFHVAGKLTGAEATITVHYGVGNRAMMSQDFTVRRADAVPGDILRRYWAQKKVDDLLVFPEANAAAITAVGKRHSIVTPGTSLIVLERLEQYIEHEIRPPASLAEMRAQYDERMQRRLIMIRDAEAQKLEKVLSMWREETSWWNKRFKYPRNFRYGAKKSAKNGMVLGAIAIGAARTRSRLNTPAAVDTTMAENESVLADERPAPAKKAKKKGGGKDRVLGPIPEPEPEIKLSSWNPDTPYLDAMKKAARNQQFAVYLRERAQHGTAPGFYLDSADFFRQQKQRALALQVLSNLAELELENPALLRVLGHRLGQLGYVDLSIKTFEQVRKMRPEEPQSYRDLALILATRAADRKRAKAERKADYERALALLAKVVMGEWQRFDRIEIIALTELNNILVKARPLGVSQAPVDKRLIAHLDMDVRIVMTWDADLTDMDLHVIEPSGEEAYYSHNLTTIGGRVSRDFTQGYGPEVYSVRRAMRGKYTIKTAFFGSSAAKLTGAVTLQVDIFTNFGRKNEKRKSITLRLTEKKESFEVGKIRY